MGNKKSIAEEIKEALRKPDVLWNVLKIIIIAVCFFISKKIFTKLFVDLPKLPVITKIMFFSIPDIVYGAFFTLLIYIFLLDRWYNNQKNRKVINLIIVLLMLLFIFTYATAVLIPLDNLHR